MDTATRLQRYAELVVKVGAAVLPGTVVNRCRGAAVSTSRSESG